ncbi:hypothetical protein CGCF413_v001639 [Colletotrichum fructicola]|nr:hypothetical protein CGCF245_v008565 [Colletotrichum fructicola]KAF5513352.1 hypothetical protein CGCF413_v001639 [Colletotrichum fructicola]
MWRLIAVVVLAIRVVQAQNPSNSTAECPNVSGFFYQDSCKLLCRETKRTDVVVFYLGNYIAHAATITTRPGQSTLITVVTMIGAVLLPGTGIWNGMKAILSLARFAPTDLQTAARAGALYAVVKDNNYHPSQASVSDGAEGIQMAAIPATVATRSSQQEQNIEKQLLEDSSVHDNSKASASLTTSLLSSNIHGLCELPDGYHLMQVPQNATFSGEDDLPVDYRPWYHYRRLANTIFPWTQPQPTRSTVALSCSYNLVRVLASIIQLIFAVSTLYRTRGDQIERYGYAAFGLTVIPYAWMSLINLVGNAICPQYDKIYVVSSRALRDLEHARDGGIRDSQTQEQTPWRVDGTVGRLEDHWDEQLCKDFEYCREQESAEQTGRTRPLLYTVFATWNRKSPSRIVLGPFIDLLNPFRHWKDWVEDTRKARRWWKDEAMRVAKEIREDPKSGLLSFYHRWKEQLLAPLIVFLVPLAIVGGLSGFQPGQSGPFQRVWVMMWLVLGLGVGFVLGQALRWFGNQSPNVYQQPTADYGGPNGFVNLWETIMGAVAYGPIAIGGVRGVKMALALRHAAPLKAQVRLAQAVSEFEASLDGEQKAAFRNARIATKATPPTPSDVMKLTAEIDSRVRKEHGPSRCFGPRLTNVLQAVQQFAALGDTVVGGSQNLVACGVWSAVRMMLHMAIGYASYLEKLSLLFMTAGRQAPRYQTLAIIYPQSKDLQRYLSEYFIVIVHICQRMQQYAMKSIFGQFKSSLNDADLKEFQADLEVWGNSIKDEATLLLNQRIQNESQENKKVRTLVTRWSASSTQRQQAIERIERKVRLLDICSTYDFQTTWKQVRKRGSTSLLPTWFEYQQWKQKVEMPSAILFSGKVGAGKSVILANIIDDLYLSGDAVIVFFFCRHDTPTSLTSRTILGSLARQYLSHFPEDNETFKKDAESFDMDELTALMEP